MSYTNGTSDRNTQATDNDGTQCPGPGCDCPDCKAERGERERGDDVVVLLQPDRECHITSDDVAMCIYCHTEPARSDSDYCGVACAVLAECER